MEKRNKGWRAQQRKLHYVRRLKYYSNSASFWYVLALWPNSRTIKNSKGRTDFSPKLEGLVSSQLVFCTSHYWQAMQLLDVQS